MSEHVLSNANWQLENPGMQQQMSAVFYDWLTDGGSLTKRLRAVTHSFEIRLRFQEWQKPIASEVNCLRLNSDEDAVVREVDIVCNGQPWIFGRTIFPKETIMTNEERLGNLGTRPLGEVLFADPNLQRQEFLFAKLNREHFEYQHALLNSSAKFTEVWGRRSLFYVADKKLLLTEVFLSEFPYV